MKNKLILGRKGTDKIISVYWFLIIFLVAGAVVYILSASHNYDVRKIEANILNEKLADCISKNGYLTETTEEMKNNLPNSCGLNFKSEFNGDGEYYVEINLYTIDNLENPYSTIRGGNLNLNNNLVSHESLTSSTSSFYALKKIEDGQQEFVVKIISIIRKTEKNA